MALRSRKMRDGMKVEGRCHCGKIAFEAVADPAAVRLCHCADCQTLSGTAFRANVNTVAGTFMVTRGVPKIYVKTADSGRKRAHAFCPDCGTPIYSSDAGDRGIVSLRIGTLKQRAAFRPAHQIWCRSALPWAMDISAVQKFDGQA
jgi:hypothetical protein